MPARARRSRLPLLLAVAAAGILATACGGDGGDVPGAEGHVHDHTHGPAPEAAAGFTFGEPGDPSAATRTIEVAAGDPFRFEPDDLELNPGETVTFVVSNEGDTVHEFVLGDRAYQDSHEEMMASGAMHHGGNAVTVAPGETQELTWTFPEDGEVLYGFHVAGHYASGMFGTITVSA